jgi:hypothetical protein
MTEREPTVVVNLDRYETPSNLAANPACTMSARIEGIDIVLEGKAQRITDSGTLERAAAQCRCAGC